MEEIKNLLDKKYECYILIGQEKEFQGTDLCLNAYTFGIISFLDNFDTYKINTIFVLNLLN